MIFCVSRRPRAYRATGLGFRPYLTRISFFVKNWKNVLQMQKRCVIVVFVMSDDDGNFSKKPDEEIPGYSDRQKEHRRNPPLAFRENAVNSGPTKSAMVKAGWDTRREHKAKSATFSAIFGALLSKRIDTASISSARKWLPDGINPEELDYKTFMALRSVRIVVDEESTNEAKLKAMEFIRDTIGEEPVKRTSDESLRPPSIVINAVSSVKELKTIETEGQEAKGIEQ